jgi:hypothetical protein
MLRKLGIFERALNLSDQHSPFNVVTVLRLENTPPPEVLKSALRTLQYRQPLMRARIEDGANKEREESALDFTKLERRCDSHWLEIVEIEMNTWLDPSTGLFRGAYLFDDGDGRAELVLTFHHATSDAASGVNLLDELLQTCAWGEDFPALELLPPVEKRFPPAYKGWRGRTATIAYAARQV